MFRKTLAAMFVPVLIAGATLAGTPAFAETGTPNKAETLNRPFSVLHSVSDYAVKVSAMADKRAKSDLVKAYAREMASANADLDAKLQRVARTRGITVAPLDPQTEAGKSQLDRFKAETVLLGSLEGDAWDKEYMTLVTNTQQSVLHFLQARKASTNDPEVKQLFDELLTKVQGRLTRAQEIMVKIYGDEV